MRKRGPGVLLVSTNRRRAPEAVPPLALAHLAGALGAAGARVAALDLLFAEDPVAALEEALDAHRPDVVGLSVRNIDNSTSRAPEWYLPEVREVALRLRALGIPVVLGGAGVSIAPEAFLRHLDLDVAVAGEGEEALPPVAAALARGEPAPDLPGVVRREGDGFRATPRRILEGLDRLPPPDYGVLDLRAYARCGGAVGVQTKRGCPHACSYCVYPEVEGRGVRGRGEAAVAREVRGLHERSGVTRIFLVDSVLNEPPEHALGVARALRDLRLPVRYSCYASPRGFTGETAAALADSGCEGVEFGTDSLSPPVLRRLGKPFGVRDVERAARACRSAGLPQCHHLILGTPGETPATLEETLSGLEGIGPDAAVITTGVRVYPGTPLARRLFRDRDDPPDLLAPYFFTDPAVEGVLEGTLLPWARRNPSWSLPGLGVNYDEERLAAVRAAGYTGPSWLLLAGESGPRP